jgi:uncharacterized membrane protein YgcG
MNFVSWEKIGLGQKALHEVYAKEESPKCDLVDYALLDTMHETKDTTYGVAYKKRELEPSMAQLLTGGYIKMAEEVEYNRQKQEVNIDELDLDEIREYQDALLRKEITKGKWMTEARDHYRQFTDDPADNVYYIGNQMGAPKRLANIFEDHYKSSYKRDYDKKYMHRDNDNGTEIEVNDEVAIDRKHKNRRSGNRGNSGGNSGGSRGNSGGSTGKRGSSSSSSSS